MPDNITTLPEWVLEEEVNMTLVYDSTSSVFSIYLLECVAARRGLNNAITLTFDNDRVLVNGTYADLGEDLMAVYSLIDDYYSQWLPGDPESTTPVGYTVRTTPYGRQ